MSTAPCLYGRRHLFYPGISLPVYKALQPVRMATGEEIAHAEPIKTKTEWICNICGRREWRED